MRWPLAKLNLIKRMSYSVNTSERGTTGHASDAIEHMNLLPKRYITVISREEVTRIHDLTPITASLCVMDAISTSHLIQANTINGKSNDWVYPRSRGLF